MIYGYSTSLQYSSDTEIFSIIISRFSVFLPSKFQFCPLKKSFLVRSEGAEAAEKCLPKKEEHKIAWQKLLIILIRNNLLIGNST